MNWIVDLVNSGVSEKEPYRTKRAIMLSNCIALILCLGIAVLYLYRIVFARDFDIINRLYLGFFLIIFTLVINKLSYTTASRLYLCYIPVIFIWYTFIVRMDDDGSYRILFNLDGMRQFLLAVSIIPYLLFDFQKPKLLMLGILPTLISFLFFFTVFGFFGLRIANFDLDWKEYELMQVRSIVAYLLVNGGCFAFQIIIYKNDRFSERLLNELTEKSEEIETQNEELKSSHEKLHEVNQHLETLVEKKTENIKQQHQKLLHYAHANSHHVRGPIARLQGLIQLLKLDSKADYPWFFEKVSEEANDIDQITRNISRDLDDLGIDEDEVKKRANHSFGDYPVK